MSITDGQEALIRHLLTMQGAPNIALPNDGGAELPRYVVQASGGAQRTILVDGTTDAFPEIVVLVETAKGRGAGQNNDFVKLLVGHFAPNTKFEGIQIIEAPFARPPLTGEVYSVPVVIRGRTFF
ncbi:hypothetical protein [Profundibacterium mesophilum]|uniref:Uncharacterized protein n=1 Tax=Profundibacterium mesophilum KAUST100406-0324 TaxID=1037889 RepID=A0A921TCM4_9RHOB|nr:hypothetical protein [Profundibacterium mesophilum]KAF0675072.1 hypothetical protein PMES_02593 [Profundibacterium mesophilum KAUST100406-0324]